jgi:CBS domain-containing protein
MMPIAVLMNRDISCVEADTTLKEVAVKMAEDRVGAALVRRGGDYVGIISETDVVRRALATGMDIHSCTVDKVMSAPLITIDVGQTVVDANEIMSTNNIRHLVVTERGDVAGIISVRDLVLYFKNRL